MCCRGTPAEVSRFSVMSNSSLPNRRLKVPSDHRITRLLDCLRCANGEFLVDKRKTKKHLRLGPIHPLSISSERCFLP